MHGEGISTPRVHHKGRQPLIECANMTSICFISLLRFYVFLYFYLFVVDKGVSLAPTYSSIVNQMLVKLFLSFFAKYVFIE